ncbi:MAG: hypothetical protein CMK64_10230 [Pseudoalteromonas sp.]|nr:hypothetical protein [Pseudoalteromonas sp.]|tara:strand:- start:3129 stop:5249 length:2121 start_codon:yes stop_codon:yes gene_type:complete
MPLLIVNMPKLNIKTRILFFVVVFEVLAYASIVLFSNFYYRDALTEIKEQEIAKTFKTSVDTIDHTITLMEQSVFNLSQHGLSIYLQQTHSSLSKEALAIKFEQLLKRHFDFFTLALGGGVWFEPRKLLRDEEYFGPYVYREQRDLIFSWDLSKPSYDYHNQDWYVLGKKSAKRGKLTEWTHPYIDEAGSHAPMMTVDAPIISEQGEFLGLATVDWSLSKLTEFLEEVKITDNSSPFLIHKASKTIISFPLNPNLAMKSIDNVDWARIADINSKASILQVERNIHLESELHDMYFIETNSGFIFGSFSPHIDINKEIKEISAVTLVGGTVIGFTFIGLMILVMKYLFKPFDSVLDLIKGSIQHTKNDDIAVRSISYKEQNEFTPIIQELNLVYEQVNIHIDAVNKSNTALQKSRLEVQQLNTNLEEKVKSRTVELNLKTQEALNALANLKAVQKKLVEQEKHASLGRLVAGIAHEINTPVGVSITASSYIDSEINSLEQKFHTCTLTKDELQKKIIDFKEGCFILKSNLQRTAELVASFKQVSVDQSSELMRKIELNSYLDDVIRTLQPRIKKTTHQVHFEQSEQSVETLCSPGAIAQVITNIVENALVHAFNKNESGEINIVLSDTKTEITILISDNGKGMTENVLDCIFDPFFTTNRENGGSGLGMHLVYNIVTQQLNGTINCSSIVNQGTQFIIKFPFVKSDR